MIASVVQIYIYIDMIPCNQDQQRNQVKATEQEDESKANGRNVNQQK